jgi:hypothetical protein
VSVLCWGRMWSDSCPADSEVALHQQNMSEEVASCLLFAAQLRWLLVRFHNSMVVILWPLHYRSLPLTTIAATGTCAAVLC